MKEIKKERVITQYDIVYVANDGTEFLSKEECQKYDESAKGVLMAKFKKLVVKETCESVLYRAGCDEDKVYVVKVKSREDVDLILQLLILIEPWWGREENAQDLQGKEKIVLRALQDDDYLFIGTGYEDDGFYIQHTRKMLFEQIEKECEPEPEKKSE